MTHAPVLRRKSRAAAGGPDHERLAGAPQANPHSLAHGDDAVGLNDIASTLLLAVAAFFYLAGTVGLLRFPDVHSRLHALTKADNLGLLFVCLAMALLSGSARVAALLAVVWLLALVASAVSAHLVARRALQFDPQAPAPAEHRAEPPA